MAQNTFMTYPLDQPRLIRPGVMHREADFHGNASMLALPPESPERAAKGDLSMGFIQNFDPRPLTTPRLPYILKR